MPPTRTGTRSIRIHDRVAPLKNLKTINPALECFLSELHHFDVSERLKVGEWRAGGGYADVYEGELKSRDISGKDEEYIKVAVNRFRVLMNANSGSARVC